MGEGRHRPGRVLLSRIDSIGDVVLTLPMAGVLRELVPEAEVLFLGRTYTRPIVSACEHVHAFYDWDDVRAGTLDDQAALLKATRADAIIHVFPRREIARAARRAKIPVRVGTTHRAYHWGACNDLVRLSRRRSRLHEAQLNLKLLRPLGARELYPLDEIPSLYGLTKLAPLPPDIEALLSPDRLNVILHPACKGSTLEWGTDHFAELIELLPRDAVHVFVTGTEAEGARVRETLVRPFPKVTDLTGRLSLAELMSFIARADGLLAASTGPLHLAAALGRRAIGLYPSRRPLHPGRWAPLGRHVTVLEDGVTTPYSGPLRIEAQRVVDTWQALV